MIYFKLVMVALFWGGTVIATRIAAQTFGPFYGAAIRYIIAIVIFVPLALHLDKKAFKISLPQFLQLCVLGFSGIFMYNFFFFKGLKTVQASHGSLLLALNPVMVMLANAFMYKEKISNIKILGAVLSLLGVIIVISRGQPLGLFDGFEKGDAYMLFCPVAWTIYTLSIRTAMKTTTPVAASTWASITGCIMLLLFAGTETFPDVIPNDVWISLFYLGMLGTVLAFIWYYEAILKIGATKTAVFNNLVPVFALLLSVVILKETVYWYTWLGALLVVGGIVMINRR